MTLELLPKLFLFSNRAGFWSRLVRMLVVSWVIYIPLMTIYVFGFVTRSGSTLKDLGYWLGFVATYPLAAAMPVLITMPWMHGPFGIASYKWDRAEPIFLVIGALVFAYLTTRREIYAQWIGAVLLSLIAIVGFREIGLWY